MVVNLHSHSDASAQPEASRSDRKVSIELPLRKVYTCGMPVKGNVHLGSKEMERIQEVKASLVCVVRSMFHEVHGESQDIRRETTKLIHRDVTLWPTPGGDTSGPPPVDLPFEMIIPDVGNDKRGKDPNAPLPPSFHAGSHRGWINFFTYRTLVGFVEYHVKVVVTRKGILKLKEKSTCPFIFLPPSSPPPLLPSPPDHIPDDLSLSEDQWSSDSKTTNIRYALISSSGHSQLTLWTPTVASFARLTRVPFVLRLALQTRHVEGASGEPHEDLLPPAPQLDKASVCLRQTIHTRARGGKQKHVNTLDTTPSDNMLFRITPEESQWNLKTADGDGGRKKTGYWEKQFVWRSHWAIKETPSFTNRQLSWEYALVAEIPIKGLGNGVKLVSQPLEVTSGIAADRDSAPGPNNEVLDLPPDHIEKGGLANGYSDSDDEKDEKA